MVEGFNVLSEFLREVKVGQENVLDVAKEVLDGKEKVTFAVQNRVLQPEQPPEPIRAESPPREHVFHTAAAAAAYLAAGYASKHTVILADAEKRQIDIVLDERAVSGVETCGIRPVIHPVFEPWSRLIEHGSRDLRAAVLFLQQHRREIVDPDGRELALTLAQIKASTTVEAQFGTIGKGRDAINGVLVTTSVRGQDHTEPVDLPETIAIEAPLFVGSKPRRVEIDLTLSSGETGKVAVGFTSTSVVAAVMEEFEAMLALLQAQLPEGGVAVLGAACRGEWEYLKDRKAAD